MPYPRHEAAAVVQALAGQLEAAGVRVLDKRACSRVGLLVTANVTIWCYGRLLHWRSGDGEMTWPAADAYGAARKVAEANVSGGSSEK